jgi:AcrR family transcriptional regulator
MRKGELTRQAILERGLSLASRVGIEGLTIGALAEALGLSKSGLYAHFRSKTALQLADHHAARLLRDRKAAGRARNSFEALLRSARPRAAS